MLRIPLPGSAMRKLNYDLWQLQQGKRDGSHGTRRERSYALAQMANTLHEKGYPGLRARNLKGKHIEALVRDWMDRGLADATMMNRMAHLRWWAKEVGKPNIVRANAEYGIGQRSHVSDGTKRRNLDMDKLERVKDAHVKMALRLQAAFGLRREEAIKFRPSWADRGDRIVVKSSTAKGGRARDVPILKDSQRKLRDDPEAPQLRGTEEGVRGPDPGRGPGPQPWIETCVCPRQVRGHHGLEGAGGGWPAAAVTEGGETAHGHGGAHPDFERAWAWTP